MITDSSITIFDTSSLRLLDFSAPNTYFYKDVKPGKHELSTESEFSDNILEVDFEGGKNYFVRQAIKIGFFVGGAILNLVSDEEGKKGVLESELAR